MRFLKTFLYSTDVGYIYLCVCLCVCLCEKFDVCAKNVNMLHLHVVVNDNTSNLSGPTQIRCHGFFLTLHLKPTVGT